MKKFIIALSGSVCSLLSACEQQALSLHGEYAQEKDLHYIDEAGAHRALRADIYTQNAVLKDAAGEAKLQLADGAVIPLHIASAAVVDAVKQNRALRLRAQENDQYFGIELSVQDRMIHRREERVTELCAGGKGKREATYRHETLAKVLELYLVEDLDADVLASYKGILQTSERKVLARATACSQEPQTPGRDLPGREQPGREQPGRDLPGRDLPGRDLPGRNGAVATAAAAA